MKKNHILGFTLSTLLLSSVFITPSANAATCLSLVNNLSFRTSDNTTNREVTVLQNFLFEKRYLSVESSGYFGTMTLAAVTAFQAANSLPATGYVGPMTRALIKTQTCGATTSTQIPNTKPAIATTTVSTATSTVPTITSFSPFKSAVETRVTIRGTGFSTSSNVVYFGESAVIKGLKSSDGKNLAFIVPTMDGLFKVNPNVYLVRVANSNGTSTAHSFTVLESIVVQPSITSMSLLKSYPGGKITLTGNGYSPVANIITFYQNGLTSTSSVATSNPKSITITIPTKLSAPCAPGSSICSNFTHEVKDGDFLTVSVTNNGLMSNSITIPIEAKPVAASTTSN